MIARSALPFTFRSILGRVGFVSTQQHIGPAARIPRNGWQRMFAALGAWSSVSDLARRSEILVCDRPEQFRGFCRDCGEDTPHEGSDEFGAGWYAQICRCRYCGKQNMRVWPLAWW